MYFNVFLKIGCKGNHFSPLIIIFPQKSTSLLHYPVSKYASSFGYSVHRNTTISTIMLIYSNNWPLQEQSYKIFPIFALTKTNRPMYTKTESKDEKMTTNQKRVESSVKKPMPSIWYT